MKPTSEQNSHKSDAPEFLAEQMLRGLTGHLRFLGFSVEEVKNPDEASKLIHENPNKIFLTASPKHFPGLNRPNACLIKTARTEQQLQEIEKHFDIFRYANPFSRCSICNCKINPIDKEHIKDQVPQNVFDSFSRFWLCPGCKRVYWRGGHIKRLTEKLLRMGVPITSFPI